MNRTLSQAFPGYVRALSAYNQGVVRRNALLKQLAEGNGSQDQLIYWDELLAEHGAVIISLRAQAVAELCEEMRERHVKLTDGAELLDLQYLPSLEKINGSGTQTELFEKRSALRNQSIDAIKVQFLEGLAVLRSEEIRRGVTTIGPHRDELRFFANEIDLGTYGSRGQIRTAVMVLKLAEVYWLKGKTGETPVLLLDETLAELDQQRRGDLLAELVENSQSIMTTTDLHLFPPSFVKKCVVWHIQDGRILEN